MSTLSEQYSENYALYKEIDKQFHAISSLDDYKKFVIKWRDAIKFLNERQKMYKKEIRRPHAAISTRVSWGSGFYNIYPAGEFQSMVRSTKYRLNSMYELRVLSKLEYHAKYKQVVS